MHFDVKACRCWHWILGRGLAVVHPSSGGLPRSRWTRTSTTRRTTQIHELEEESLAEVQEESCFQGGKTHERNMKLTICKDDAATIKIAPKGQATSQRHISRTHRVNLAWLVDGARMARSSVVDAMVAGTRTSRRPRGRPLAAGVWADSVATRVGATSYGSWRSVSKVGPIPRGGATAPPGRHERPTAPSRAPSGGGLTRQDGSRYGTSGPPWPRTFREFSLRRPKSGNRENAGISSV